MFLMLAEMLHLSHLKKLVTSDGWLAWGADWIAFHTTHVAWRGCSLHDMIQPSFSFLVGTAMAFSIVARGSKGQTWYGMFWHSVFRSLVLVFLGIFLRSLGEPITKFTFDDTLTQIGLGYWILFLLSGLSIRGLTASVGVVLLGYWLAFVCYPAPALDFPYEKVGVPSTWTEHYQGVASHFNKNSNLASAVDRWWMNLFPRQKPFEFSGGGYCTLSFIPTLGTMLLGLIAGKMLQGYGANGRKQSMLWGAAAACIVLAIAIDASGLCPIVKKIWTPTWALWSGGLCFVWLATLNLVCDVGGYKRWGFPFLVIGANSIAAYVMSWTVKEPIRQAIERHFGFFIDKLNGFITESTDLGNPEALRQLILGASTLGVLWLILLWMYRKRIFLKI